MNIKKLVQTSEHAFALFSADKPYTVIKANKSAQLLGIIEGRSMLDAVYKRDFERLEMFRLRARKLGTTGIRTIRLTVGVACEFEAVRISDNTYFICVSAISGIRDSDVRRYKFTSTELDVISLIRQRLTSKEIADRLSVSTRTIENHRQSIRKKMKLEPNDNLRMKLLSMW